jgi:signal transduction histidine kinase
MTEPSSIAIDLVSSADPIEIIRRLVEHAAKSLGADRCTLSSLDQDVIRIEASHEPGQGTPSWVGREYPLSAMDSQPLLREAVENARIVTGGAFTGAVDPLLAPNLEPVQRTAIIPLLIEHRVGAVLILSRRHDQRFAAEELTSLQQIGVVAILALRNARALQATQLAQERGLNALTLVSEHLAASAELTIFFGRMSRSVAELVYAGRAAFWMVQEDALVAQADAHGFSAAALARMRVVIDQQPGSPMQRLLAGGEALGSRNIDPAQSAYRDVLEAMDIRNVIAVPWRTSRRTLGMLVAADSETGFSEQDVWVLRIAARASALVWQGHQAEQRLADAQAREYRRLMEHAERLEALDREKSEFLMMASHELRTPITLVNGYVSLLKEGALGQLPADADAILNTVSSRVAQMNLLVNQILGAARGEEHPSSVSVIKVPLDRVVRAVAENLSGLCQRGQRVLVEAPPRGVSAYADPEHVEMIIGNLISNAIKFSPRGTDVRVVVGASEGVASVQVIDSGVGIGKDDMPRLFTRFGRLQNADVSNVEGTGLGLHISRQLSRRQGGDITVRSKSGEGSVFTLTLPAKKTGATPAASRIGDRV